MIEVLEEATGQPVSRETLVFLERFSSRLREEGQRQNLVAASTYDQLWNRHILDSAQLIRFSRSASTWADVGSGAGLPGIVVAIATGDPVTLIEPRKLRADFLRRVVGELGLKAEVMQRKVEQVVGAFDIITARAVAPLSKLLAVTHHLSHDRTQWILPKGRKAKSELAEAQLNWHYDLRVEPSCTDPEASILLLSKVRAKA